MLTLINFTGSLIPSHCSPTGASIPSYHRAFVEPTTLPVSLVPTDSGHPVRIALTPHPLTLADAYIRRSPSSPREPFPEASPGVIYIVDAIVCEAARNSGRDDVYSLIAANDSDGASYPEDPERNTPATWQWTLRR